MVLVEEEEEEENGGRNVGKKWFSGQFCNKIADLAMLHDGLGENPLLINGTFSLVLPQLFSLFFSSPAAPLLLS